MTPSTHEILFLFIQTDNSLPLSSVFWLLLIERLSLNLLRYTFSYYTPKSTPRDLLVELRVSTNNLEDFQLKDLRI